MGSIQKRYLKNLATLLGVPVSLLLTLFYNEYKPEKQEKVEPFNRLQSLSLRGNHGFDLLSWNIQFCGTRNHQFFYDGGPAVQVPVNDVENCLKDITQLLQQEAADIYLLQEIDRYSQRTHYVDQLRHLTQALHNYSFASTPYFRSSFVPAPFGNPMGKVEMHLAMLSRFPLRKANRIRLSLLAEARLRQVFNLKRAILTAKVNIADRPYPLQLAVTHLSAFSYGDGTLQKQIRTIDEWISSQPDNRPWILAGDFNLLPPGDSPNRLGEEQKYYSDQENPLSILTKKYKTAFPDLVAPKHRTYWPFGATKADRKIDYIFYGGPLEVMEANVLHHIHMSDHFPLKVRFSLH